MYQKKGAFVAAALLLGTALGSSAPGIPSPENISADQGGRGNERPAPTASKDTLGPSIEEARQMIVGIWVEDVDGDIGSYKKGDLKWVFTEDGRVRKYRNGRRYATQDYAVVGKYDGQQAPDDIAGYLKFTDQDGDIQYMTLTSISQGSKRPHLYVKTHGMAGGTESLYFMPPRVFE